MKQTLIVTVIISLVISVCAQDEGTTSSRATKATSTAMDAVKTATNTGARVVQKAADGVTVKVERIVNPEPHQPGASNLLVSAGRGVGRLVRNFTVEAARAIGSVGGSAAKFVRNTSGATIETVRQAAYRIANPRHIKNAQSSGSSNNDDSSSSSSGDEAANKVNGQEPDELKKQKDNSD